MSDINKKPKQFAKAETQGLKILLDREKGVGYIKLVNPDDPKQMAIGAWGIETLLDLMDELYLKYEFLEKMEGSRSE